MPILSVESVTAPLPLLVTWPELLTKITDPAAALVTRVLVVMRWSPDVSTNPR
jgi:hypothetical protein